MHVYFIKKEFLELCGDPQILTGERPYLRVNMRWMKGESFYVPLHTIKNGKAHLREWVVYLGERQGGSHYADVRKGFLSPTREVERNFAMAPSELAIQLKRIGPALRATINDRVFNPTGAQVPYCIDIERARKAAKKMGEEGVSDSLKNKAREA